MHISPIIALRGKIYTKNIALLYRVIDPDHSLSTPSFHIGKVVTSIRQVAGSIPGRDFTDLYCARVVQGVLPGT